MKNRIILSFGTFVLMLGSFQLVFAQKKAKTFTVSSIVNAPADKVWQVVGEDYGAIAHSHPKIVSSNYLKGTLKAGEGAERVCNFNEKGTRYLHEKQLQFDPSNYTFRNQVFKAGKFPVDPDYTFAIYKVEPIDENTSKFTFNMSYRTKPAFLGGMMKGNFKKLIGDYIIAIEHHVQTGESVNRDNFREIKRAYAAR